MGVGTGWVTVLAICIHLYGVRILDLLWVTLVFLCSVTHYHCNWSNDDLIKINKYLKS